MFRKFLYLLLIFSVFCQAGALTTGALSAQVSGAESGHAGHAVLHWQESDHHHHDDGGLHTDESSSTADHMHAESVGNTPGLLAAAYRTTQALPFSAPAMQGDPDFLSLHPDGLLRPPKAST